MENYAKSNCGHPHSKPRKASSRTTSSRRSAASRCPRCWATTRQASRWTPTPTSPPTHSSKRRKRWGASSPVRYRPFRYPLPLGSAFGSEKSSGRKQQLMQTKRPEALRFRVFLARREGFEPPAFWSVGCLTRKSKSFRLRFVLFAIIRSADFPLFPSSPARFFGFWVKSGSATVCPPPLQQRLVVHRAGGDSKTDLDDLIIRAVQPNTVDLQSRIDLRLGEEVRAENCSDFSHIVQSCGRIVHKFYGII